MTTPNILTILLSRSESSVEQYPGQITVSDIIPGMENITNQPMLPVTTNPSSQSSNQHWQVLLDSNSIIGPDGQPIISQTIVSSTKNSSQLTAIFDTDFTFNQVPRYARLPAANRTTPLTTPIYPGISLTQSIPAFLELNLIIIPQTAPCGHCLVPPRSTLPYKSVMHRILFTHST